MLRVVSITDPEERPAIEDVVPIDHLLPHSGGSGDDLEGRTGRIETLSRAIKPSAGFLDLVVVLGRYAIGQTVRIERRLARQGEDLAGMDVDHYRRSGQEVALGVHQFAQRTFRRLLNPIVERKHHVPALLWFTIF